MNLYGPDGLTLPMRLSLPGKVNRGNAAQAVAAAVALGADPPPRWPRCRRSTRSPGYIRPFRWVSTPRESCWPRTPPVGRRRCRWSTRAPTGVVIAVNGQVPDGEDLSWLWDVDFEHFEGVPVVAAGERGTDLAVRLGYRGVPHTLVATTPLTPSRRAHGTRRGGGELHGFLRVDPDLGTHAWLTVCGIGLVLPT